VIRHAVTRGCVSLRSTHPRLPALEAEHADAIPSQHPMRDRSAPQNGLSAAKQGRPGSTNGARNGSSLRARPYAPPIDPIFGSGIAIAPARILGRLTSRRLVGSTGSVIFCQRDRHCPAVWRVCHIPPRKLPDCFDNLSMPSSIRWEWQEQDLPRAPSQADVRSVGLLRVGESEAQNQGREPDDRDEAQPPPPQNGFGCSRTARAGRGLVRAACFLVSFFGSSATLLFAIAGAGSAAARIGGNASDGGGGTHGESA